MDVQNGVPLLFQDLSELVKEIQGYVQHHYQDLLPTYVRHTLEELTVALPIALFLYFRYRLPGLIRALIGSRTFWALLSALWCIWSSSGGMWNYLNKPKLFQQTKKGEKLLSHLDTRQTLAESYFIAVFNFGAALGMILIIEAAGGVRNKSNVSGNKSKSSLVLHLQLLLGLALYFCCFLVIGSTL